MPILTLNPTPTVPAPTVTSRAPSPDYFEGFWDWLTTSSSDIPGGMSRSSLSQHPRYRRRYIPRRRIYYFCRSVPRLVGRDIDALTEIKQSISCKALCLVCRAELGVSLGESRIRNEGVSSHQGHPLIKPSQFSSGEEGIKGLVSLLVRLTQ